ELYGVRTTDAQTWSIGTIGHSGLGDLVWYGDDLYLSSGGGLVRITLTADAAAIQQVTQLSTSDPNWPGCEGLATVNLTPDRTSIVGVYFPDLVCFSPVDNSYQVICQVPLPGGVPGAASFRPAPAIRSGCSDGAQCIEAIDPPPGMNVRDGVGYLRCTPGRYERWMLLDMSGRMLAEGPIAPNGERAIDLSRCSTGILALRLFGASGQRVVRFVQAVRP
ncbi:MAG TPA: hypothetical protein VHL57_00890, partial [Flavobacteriales bacterium]|nr:hypothetical protein [Flavobacteriales bacterium]